MGSVTDGSSADAAAWKWFAAVPMEVPLVKVEALFWQLRMIDRGLQVPEEEKRKMEQQVGELKAKYNVEPIRSMLTSKKPPAPPATQPRGGGN